jgi:hypothetical protein
MLNEVVPDTMDPSAANPPEIGATLQDTVAPSPSATVALSYSVTTPTESLGLGVVAGQLLP